MSASYVPSKYQSIREWLCLCFSFYGESRMDQDAKDGWFCSDALRTSTICAHQAKLVICFACGTRYELVSLYIVPHNPCLLRPASPCTLNTPHGIVFATRVVQKLRLFRVLPDAPCASDLFFPLLAGAAAACVSIRRGRRA